MNKDFYLLSSFLFLVLICILLGCSGPSNSFEIVYDLPKENVDINYYGLKIKEEQDVLNIQYSLPYIKNKTSGLYLRSQYHYYFLESVSQGNGNYAALLNKELLKRGVYEIGICPDITSPEVIFLDYYFSTTATPERIKSLFSDQLQHSIEKFKIDSSKVKIQGWAYRKNQSMNYHIIDIGLVHDSSGYFYETELQTRKDVTSYFDLGFNVDYSGFHAVIPTHGLPRGVYNVAVKITNLIDSTSFVSLSDKYVILPQRLDSLPTETSNLSYNIENINTSNNSLHITGWAYLNGKSTENSQIYLLFKSDVVFAVQLNVLERRDVTSYFHSKVNIDRSGFNFILDHGLPKAKKYQLGVLIINEDDYGVAYFKNYFSLNL